MALYGILNSTQIHTGNTGLDSELQCVFCAPLSIDSNTVDFVNDTVTLKRNTYRTEPQRWEIEAAISKVDASTKYLVHSVIYGKTQTFYTRMPQPIETFSFPEAIPLRASASYARGVDVVDVYHVTMQGKLIPPGMFIQFGGHPKVYLVLESSSSEITNTLKIFPKLVGTVANNDTVYYGAQVSMASVFDTNTKIGIAYEDGITAGISGVKIVEKL